MRTITVSGRRERADTVPVLMAGLVLRRDRRDVVGAPSSGWQRARGTTTEWYDNSSEQR